MTTPTKAQRTRERRGSFCPIGPMRMHTRNAEDTECIWCGPNGLAWKPGHWVTILGDPRTGLGEHSAWSATEPFIYGPTKRSVDG